MLHYGLGCRDLFSANAKHAAIRWPARRSQACWPRAKRGTEGKVAVPNDKPLRDNG